MKQAAGEGDRAQRVPGSTPCRLLAGRTWKTCSLHRTEIGMIENGDRLPRADTLMKLAGALEVGAELLLRGLSGHRRPLDRRQLRDHLADPEGTLTMPAKPKHTRKTCCFRSSSTRCESGCLGSTSRPRGHSARKNSRSSSTIRESQMSATTSAFSRRRELWSLLRPSLVGARSSTSTRRRTLSTTCPGDGLR